MKTEDFPLPKNNTIDVTVLQITLSLSSMALAPSFCLPLSAFVERRRIRPIETEQGQSLLDFCVTFDSTLPIIFTIILAKILQLFAKFMPVWSSTFQKRAR